MEEGQTTSTCDISPKKIEQLGRMRPVVFRNGLEEACFISTIVASQLLAEYFVSGFTVLAPTLVYDFGARAPSATLPTSAFCLVVSAFILPFGRLADIYGGFPIYLAGCMWTCLWSLIAGFCQTNLLVILVRGMQGLGSAAALPAGLTLLGNVYRPGPRKNVIFSLYGAMAPLGFFSGVAVAGSVAEYVAWSWYFWIAAIVTALKTILSLFVVPKTVRYFKNPSVTMDWLGSLTIAAALILVIFSITESADAALGWRTPYVYVTFGLGLAMSMAAIYVEAWVAKDPLIPSSIFRIKCMRPLLLALLFAYGTIGIFMLYSNLYIQGVLKVRPITVVAWYAPMAVAGFIFALLGGYILHIISTTVLLIASFIAVITSSLLFALLPADASYWKWVLPAMICATFSIDVLFNAANVFLSTSLPARQQGLAGALANLLLYLSTSILLGFAELLVARTSSNGQERSYEKVFWLELSCGVAALAIALLFIRIERAKSDLTVDEKEVLITED